MLALYRKYRPQFFSELVGQEHVRTTLENEIKKNKVTHAYIFFGPRGLGKTTMARLIAKAVNCEKRKEGESEPCNSCYSCLEIQEGKSLDLIEIDAASNRGINEIRQLRDHVKITPSRSKYKVFIIDEVHMLTPEAFNALLKTLEEPPAHVIFVLVTTEIHKVPQTIISRCQRFDFFKIPKEEIVKRLENICQKENIKVERQVLESIAERSEGCVRDAESFLEQVMALGEKEISKEIAELIIPPSNLNLILNLVSYLEKKDLKKSLILINKLTEEGVDLKNFIADLIEFLRKILLVKVGNLNLNEKEISDFSQKIDLERLKKMIEIFIETRKKLDYSEIPQLPIELALVEICSDFVEKFESEGR